MTIHEKCLDIAGAVSIPDQENPGELVRVVFQGTSEQFANYRNGLGKPKMQRAYVIPNDPMTPAQLNQRAKMALAVNAWHAATEPEKAAFIQAAKTRKITVYMAFVSAYIKALPPSVGTLWDDGTTTWNDEGTSTIWDI